MSIKFEDVLQAAEAIKKLIPPSPLLYNPWLSSTYGCDVYLKLENMQPIGSFKIRGATYKILSLTEEEKAHGVIAASAGNHAQGVAWGAKRLGVKAQIVMPRSAALMKIQRTRNLGADVLLEGDTYDEAFEVAKRVAAQTNATLIHAFDDPKVMAGQGTVALEILEQLPDVDVVMASMGGGGLMTGVATVLKQNKKNSNVQLLGCQAAGASALVKSIKEKRPIKLKKMHTFADGIAVANPSEIARTVLTKYLDYAVEVEDEAIAGSVLTLLEKAKIVAEGSGAAPLAALDQQRELFSKKKVVLIISGGNIDVNIMGRIIDLGLVRNGRRLRVNVLISDQTGSLSKLTRLIAKEGANIIQCIHDRNSPLVRLDQTGVEFTLETRGLEHSQKLIELLRENTLKLQVL